MGFKVLLYKEKLLPPWNMAMISVTWKLRQHTVHYSFHMPPNQYIKKRVVKLRDSWLVLIPKQKMNNSGLYWYQDDHEWNPEDSLGHVLQPLPRSLFQWKSTEAT